MNILLGTILKQKFPSEAGLLPHERAYQVLDDGAGPYIAAWNAAKLGPQPTPAQLAQWAAEYVSPPPPSVQKRMADLGVSLADLKQALAEPAAAPAK